MERKHVGIVLFENIEVLDFCGPFEVFSAARLNEDSDGKNYHHLKCCSWRRKTYPWSQQGV